MIRRRYPPHAIFTCVFAIACVFAFTALAGIVPAAEVTATRLDGTTVSGDLRQWTDNDLVITTPTGDQRIVANQLVSLRWQPAATSPAPAEKNSGLVELIDGSVLPIKSIQVEKSQATITLARSAAPDDNPLDLPVDKLVAMQLRPLDGPLAAQWNEMRRQNLANDVLAVLKKDGKSLDYVEGVMGDISDAKIEFKLEGETQHVDRAKIAGAIYYRPNRRSLEEPRASLQGRAGLRVIATHIELKDSRLELTTAAGAKLSWPIEDISLADFSAGKLMYLSDIEPASTNWTPLVGLPSAAKVAAEYGQPHRDKSAYGGPLALVMKDSESASTQTATRFNKGLALRSRTEIIYRLPAGFQRFLALAGIDPATSADGNVRLTISGDDRNLLDTEIAGDQAPHPIQLDIANIKRLKIVVDYGQNLDSGDWLNLCEARIVK